ncbi:MAG: hydroxypyruvate isomerase family protein [Phycisphaerales bacterium]
MKRREFLASSLAAAALAGSTTAASASPAPARKGRLKQSICRWCFGGVELSELCTKAKAIGYQSIELLGEKEWEIPAKHGLTCAVANGPTAIGNGYNRTENHDRFTKESERLLPLVKAANIPNMIVFSGNRAGMSDAEGLKNCAAGLKRITPLAEQLGVTIIMELLNSKVDHKDYMCDRTPWGVNLVNEVASPRFKLLYDIYHMQIMEGDVIRTITDHADAIGHYHTAGVPGRQDLDDAQELQYAPIARAIIEKGYTGFFGQEFMAKGEPFAALKAAFELCDV